MRGEICRRQNVGPMMSRRKTFTRATHVALAPRFSNLFKPTSTKATSNQDDCFDRLFCCMGDKLKVRKCKVESFEKKTADQLVRCIALIGRDFFVLLYTRTRQRKKVRDKIPYFLLSNFRLSAFDSFPTSKRSLCQNAPTSRSQHISALPNSKTL
jgi:hypothetical protein